MHDLISAVAAAVETPSASQQREIIKMFLLPLMHKHHFLLKTGKKKKLRNCYFCWWVDVGALVEKNFCHVDLVLLSC